MYKFKTCLTTDGVCTVRKPCIGENAWLLVDFLYYIFLRLGMSRLATECLPSIHKALDLILGFFIFWKSFISLLIFVYV